MNGYFNNLALRSMNAGNLVEPRLPGLFEPQRKEPDAAAPGYSEPWSEPRSEPRTEPRTEPQPGSVAAPPTESPALKVSIEEPSVAEDITGPQPAAATARPDKTSNEPPAPVERSTNKDQTTPISVAKQPAVAEPPAVVTETVSTDQPTPQSAPTETRGAPKYAIKSVRSVAHHSEKTKPWAEVTNFTPQTFPVLRSSFKPETTSAVEEHEALIE